MKWTLEESKESFALILDSGLPKRTVLAQLQSILRESRWAQLKAHRQGDKRLRNQWHQLHTVTTRIIKKVKQWTSESAVRIPISAIYSDATLRPIDKTAAIVVNWRVK